MEKSERKMSFQSPSFSHSEDRNCGAMIDPDRQARNCKPTALFKRVVRPTHSLRRGSLAQGLHQQLQQLPPKGATPFCARHCFRKYARLAVKCVRLCKLSRQSLEDESGEFLSVHHVLDNINNTVDRHGLFFDPRDYRANVQEHLSLEARRILQMDPQVRSERDIEYLLIVLQSIPAFAEYPKRMQRKLCQTGWYESYEPRRAILREGDPPHSFYFILSGQVLVTTFEDGSARTLVSLERGMSFGELAVITNSRRQATVSTKTNVELLCLSAWDQFPNYIEVADHLIKRLGQQDFENIFMAGGTRTITDPDHNTFLRNITFLKQWPVERLSDNPQACMFHYFNRGQVLVRDSKNSDWIYIVKSGSLSVLKKLKHVTASSEQLRVTHVNEGRHVTRGSLDSSRRNKTWYSRNAERGKRGRRRRSTSPEIFHNQAEAEKRLEQSLPGLFNTKERLGLLDYDKVMQDYRARVIPSNLKETLHLPKIDTSSRGKIALVHPAQTPEGAEDDGPRSEGAESVEPAERTEEEKTTADVIGNTPGQGERRPISKTAKGVYLAASPVRRRKCSVLEQTSNRGSGRSQTDALRETPVTESPAAQSDTSETTQDSVAAELNKLNADYQRRFRERVGRKTMAEALDYKGSRDFKYTEVDLSPMFILVQILERGQYFGVSQILYPDQPSLCLVSNGAECIVLSKRLFLEHANEACLRAVGQLECPFPDDDSLQKRLQKYVEWQAHRSRVYRRLVDDIREKQSRRKQFLPHIPGQYCFRSGAL